MFEVLLGIEAVLCCLLVGALLQAFRELDEAPEVRLGERAWTAARHSMAEARALGPLFKHLVRASHYGLSRAHHMQEQIRTGRVAREPRGVLAPLGSLWQRRKTLRSEELAELAHLVEQLEYMGRAVARYRAGIGGLWEVGVPLSCMQERASRGRTELRTAH